MKHIASHLALNSLAMVPEKVDDRLEPTGVQWVETEPLAGVKVSLPRSFSQSLLADDNDERFLDAEDEVWHEGYDSDEWDDDLVDDSKICDEVKTLETESSNSLKTEQDPTDEHSASKDSPGGSSQGSSKGSKGSKVSKKNRARMKEGAMPRKEQIKEHSQTAFIKDDNSAVVENIADVQAKPWVTKVWATGIKLLTTPAVGAALLATVIGLIAPLKDLLVGTDWHILGTKLPPLNSIYSAISILGTAQVPVAMLLLSGSGTLRYLKSLSEDSDTSQMFSFKSQVLIMLGRILIMPPVGMAAWEAMRLTQLSWSFDKLMSFVALIEAAVPTANNIIMLILVTGDPRIGHALSVLVLKQYALCVPIFTLFTAYVLVTVT